MDSSDLELAKKIKIKFGTATTEPSAAQLDKIKHDIQALHARGTNLSEDDWLEVVRRYCPDAGGYKYLYQGVETPELASLLELALKN